MSATIRSSNAGEANPEQFPVPLILLATFLPAALILFSRIFWGLVADDLQNWAAMGAQFSQALILILVMVGLYRFTRRYYDGQDAPLIPYRLSRPFWILALAFLIAAALPIALRDFIVWEGLNSFAMSLNEAIPFWPPASVEKLAFVYPIQEGTAKSTQIAVLTGLMLAYGTVSAMQTLYFRGFLLPRMDRWGWWAVLANSVLFAAFHLGSPHFWLHFFIWTVIWGIVTYATRNIWPALLAHVTFNTYSFVLAIAALLSAS